MDLDQIAQQVAEDIETQCTDVTDPLIKVIVRRAIRDARWAGRRDGLEQAAHLLETESFLMRHEYARAIRALKDD